MHAQDKIIHRDSPAPGSDTHFRPPAAPVTDPVATELVRQLRGFAPQSSNFDRAVRRFVRTRRADGQELEAVVGELRLLLRDQVAPLLAPEQRARAMTAVLWFAVSEFHRAD